MDLGQVPGGGGRVHLEGTKFGLPQSLIAAQFGDVLLDFLPVQVNVEIHASISLND